MSSKFYSNGECKKFQPNIFNKIKCTYCFKPKEEHSNEALESNRVTRKAVKCGYLFVAPFSDFSNPINKTKRWQRRWFVLYDDGELKYALDDYPETVPQACIDMNKVLDVQNAEERTSHPFSISINTGESIHYVKATCREEAQWWSDVLNSFRARKSKATGVASTPYSTRITSSSNSSVWESGDIFPTRERDVQVNNASNNENNMSAANVQTKIYVGSPPTRDKVTTDEKTRIRSSSNRSSPMSPDYSRSNTNNMDFNRTSPNSGSEFSRTSTNNNTEFSRTSTNASEFSRAPSNNGPEFSRTSTNNGSEFSRTSTSASDFSRAPSNNGPEFSRTSTNNASESSSTRLSASGSSSRLSASGTSNGSNSRLSVGGTSNGSNSRLSASDGSNSRLSSSTTSDSSNSRLSASGTSNGSNSRLSASGTSNGSNSRLSASGTSNGSNSRLSASGTSSGSNSRLSASGASNGSSTRLSHSGSSKSSSSLEEASKMNGLSAWDSTDTVSSSPSRLRRSSNNSQSSSVLMDEKPVRGDPDGCGLDLSPLRRHSPTPAELRLDLTGNTEHYLNMKKGWLMKQSGTEQTWTKHWFVLRGCSLLYYRDPKAEESGVLDGVVALNNVTSLSEVPVARNFGFQITTWDSKRTILSAVTAGIRNNWMSAIKRTAAMSLLDDKASPSSSTVQQDSPSTPRSILFSSDDEYRTASEGGRRGSTASDWGEILPPSPPLIRTPISRVKERARSIARAGSGPASGGSTRLSMSRSKSSPPSSRRSTLDSNEKLSSSSSPLLTESRQHRLEVDELKVQLNNSLLELTNAEQEILSLKHFKLQVEELSKKLHRCEELLKQRSEEVTELGAYKTRYFQEKSTWEAELNAAEIELMTSGQRCEDLCRQLGQSRDTVSRLRQELDSCRSAKSELEERMNRGMEENESLYRRIRELEGNHSLRESKGRSMDSLSDLTNVYLDLDLDQLDKDRVVEEFDNLRSRFEKAVSEIRVMKRELRLAQSEQDCVELSLIAMSQELKAQQERSDSQTCLMASKIQDLTLKLSLAEKQVRAFRHKMSKLETRDKRHRSLSLKTDGKESLSLCKELEEKLYQLEVKLGALERGDKSSAVERPSSGGAKVPPRIRRKSLDSVNEPPTADPMKILFRVTDLEKRIGKASGAFSSLSQIDENEKSTGGKARSPAEKSRPSFDTPSIVRDEVDASPSGALDLLSSETGLPEHRGSVGSPRLFPPKPKFICSSAEPERSQDEEQHTSLLHSIEYEVLQIENLVREHSHSLSELELADSSLNDTAWIADLSVKCVEIKQQIVSLQEYLKQNELGAICSRCCETDEDPIPCKQCAEFSHQLREKEEHCEAMEKLCRDQEEALRRKEQEYRELCERCGELESSEQTYKERLERLQQNSSSPCAQCEALESELQTKENTYLVQMKKLEALCETNYEKCYELEARIRDKDKLLEDTLEAKRREYENKLDDLSNEYEEEKEHLISVHEEQTAQFKEKIRTLESRLGTLDSDYSEEINKLRAAYEESLTSTGNQDLMSGTKYKHEMEHIKVSTGNQDLMSGTKYKHEMEHIKVSTGNQDLMSGTKYKHEMEHIKSLCEKGLQAMESSHRRMIEELKAKHAEEIESLRQEKEQALREETEATLAALDVMRKAHDLEVEKKMNSIMKRMQANHDMSTLHSQHQAEMEAIKQEIISLSEKYSAKCVESSDLNERLRHLTRSLTAARAHISDLEMRNAKLRAHINEKE
ncbi:hypothetical protein M8J76_010854 [Diaphorina citri]|nr:hypothetical protein M8J76_010854 [Diaphorina citri]